MKTLLISRVIISCSLVCCVSSGYSQELPPPHEEHVIHRTNVSGYGTSTIHYQVPASQHVVSVEKLTDYLQQFEGIEHVAIDANAIDISFDEVKNAGQLDLLFERVEVLYLRNNP